MLALAFLKWWYGAGWMRLARAIERDIIRIMRTFSVPILIQTLFSPWRRIINYGNRNIAESMRAMLDNFISRCVGFVVRTLVIFVALLAILGTGLLGGVALVVWPAAPLIGLAMLVKGVLPW